MGFVFPAVSKCLLSDKPRLKKIVVCDLNAQITEILIFVAHNTLKARRLP